MTRKKLVMKFGGTSVANMDRIRRACEKVKAESQNGYDIAVVVSAMSGVTNQLVDYVDQAHATYDPAEYDAVVSTGELVTAGLTAMCLQNIGCDARSFLEVLFPSLQMTHIQKHAFLIFHRKILKNVLQKAKLQSLQASKESAKHLDGQQH